MNSYISSFKALIAALAIIGTIEVSYAALAPSSPVERSGYLNWNFNSVELFHKIVIREKLLSALRDRPDVIQVGDSSGLHGIVPGIVDSYLGGLRYENLSCCANTGFDGYYTIAEFALRHVPSIKVVVVYITLFNTPRTVAPTDLAFVGGEDRLRTAFGELSPYMTPPTLAARQDIVPPVYTLGGSFFQRGMQAIDAYWPELTSSLRASRGWLPENDVNYTADKQGELLARVCGPTDVGDRQHNDWDFVRDAFTVPRTPTDIQLRRLAALAARHGAKLILMFQPFPCRNMSEPFLSTLKAEIAAVKADYPNLVVPDEALLEPWPRQWFVTPDHLRTGHEDAASRRLGRAVAAALGIPLAEPPAAPETRLVTLWSGDSFAAPDWSVEGMLLTAPAQGPGVIASETATNGWHYLRTALAKLPDAVYQVSVTFRIVGKRQLYLEFQSLAAPVIYPAVQCDPSARSSRRTVGVLDSKIEALPDGVFRCTMRVKLASPGADLKIGLTPRDFDRGPYAGDPRDRLELLGFEFASVNDVR